MVFQKSFGNNLQIVELCQKAIVQYKDMTRSQELANLIIALGCLFFLPEILNDPGGILQKCNNIN